MQELKDKEIIFTRLRDCEKELDEYKKRGREFQEIFDEYAKKALVKRAQEANIKSPFISKESKQEYGKVAAVQPEIKAEEIKRVEAEISKEEIKKEEESTEQKESEIIEEVILPEDILKQIQKDFGSL